MPHCSPLTFDSKNNKFLDIPAVTKICGFGWAECPTSPTHETIAPKLKRRISKFSRGHIAEGLYNLAEHAISELLCQPDGSFKSRTYTSVMPSAGFERVLDELIMNFRALNHDGYGGVTRLDIFFFVYRFTSKTLRSKASAVIACEVLESSTKYDRLSDDMLRVVVDKCFRHSKPELVQFIYRELHFALFRGRKN